MTCNPHIVRQELRESLIIRETYKKHTKCGGHLEDFAIHCRFKANRHARFARLAQSCIHGPSYDRRHTLITLLLNDSSYLRTCRIRFRGCPCENTQLIQTGLRVTALFWTWTHLQGVLLERGEACLLKVCSMYIFYIFTCVHDKYIIYSIVF